MVGMAQSASAPDCGSGGRGFESLYPPFVRLTQTVSFIAGKDPADKLSFQGKLGAHWAIAKR